MKLKNNYLLFFLLTILICCKTLKSPQNKTTYYHYDDFTRVSEKLVLYNDNTFFLKSRDVCNNEDYFGIWRIDNDTIYMQVTKPNIYKTNLSYKVIERENDSIQHIIITDKYEGFGFVGWVNINDSINTEEFIAGTDSSGVYKVYPKRKIKKLSIYGGNPYPTFSIEFNPPKKKSLEVKIFSYPKTYCKIPEKTKWLISNDTIYTIRNEKVIRDSYVIKVKNE